MLCIFLKDRKHLGEMIVSELKLRAQKIKKIEFLNIWRWKIWSLTFANNSIFFQYEKVLWLEWAGIEIKPLTISEFTFSHRLCKISKKSPLDLNLIRLNQVATPLLKSATLKKNKLQNSHFCYFWCAQDFVLARPFPTVNIMFCAYF